MASLRQEIENLNETRPSKKPRLDEANIFELLDKMDISDDEKIINLNNESLIKKDRVDDEVFKDLLEEVEGQNNPNLIFKLSNMYYKGRGVKKNYEKAFKECKKASDQGHANAKFKLANMHYNGEGTEKNYQKAFCLYEEAANQKHADALNSLGEIYQDGLHDENIDIRKDIEKAVSYYRLAAEQENADAQYNCALIYLKGEGLKIQKDTDRAIIYFKKAADQGHADAAYELGMNISKPKNVHEIHDYFEKAAQRRHSKANFELCKIYKDGQDVIQDYEKAHRYCKQAISYEYSKEQEYLETLEDYRNELEDLLNQDTDSEDENYEYQEQRKPVLNSFPEEELKKLNEDLKRKRKTINFAENYKDFYVACYRGIHYLPENFTKKSDRKKHRTRFEESKPLYSSTVHTLTRSTFLTDDISDKSSSEKYAEKLKMALDEFRKSFPDIYNKFHETYTNDHKKFHKLLKNPSDEDERDKSKSQAFINYSYFFNRHIDKIGNMLEREDFNFYRLEGFLRNPYVSFSLDYTEAAKYGLGEKSFHSKDGTKAESLPLYYNKDGKPEVVYFGKIYLALFKLEDYFESNPYDVVGQHSLGHINVSTHYAKHVLCENEISFPSFVPENIITHAKPIRIPSFSREYQNYYQKKYGIRKNFYEHVKQELDQQRLSEKTSKKICKRVLTSFSENLLN